MAKIKWQVDLRDVQRAFRALEPTYRKHIAFGVEAASKDVVALAKAYAPVRQGFLREWITYKVSKRTGWGMVGIADGKAPTGATSSAGQYPSVYGRFVHEGTKHLQPNPFMRRAAEASRGPAAASIRAACEAAGGDLERQWQAAAAARKGAAG